MIKSIKPALTAVALSVAMLSQGAVAAEEQFFPIPGYRVGPYGANGQSFYGGFIDYLNYALVPVILIVRAGLLPDGALALAIGALPLLASGYPPQPDFRLHPAIAEAAVIAIPDEKWSERPLACVVLIAGEQATPDELNEWLLERSFAKWQLPERYEFIDAVPRTSTGKFWKLKLREQFPG